MTGWNTLKRTGFAALFTAAAVSPGLAANAGHGEELALQWCSACHLVSNDQNKVSVASVPSFFDIARRPGFNEDALKTFLADPHPQMPNMTLSNGEIADIARYISSLSE
ncbi:c-type cytochrome [Roseibium sp.]|uniref:c-type cytochrome n=1 Tax=Roseibium sp. TaxID=1936156 RepID=UPI003A97C2A7